MNCLVFIFVKAEDDLASDFVLYPYRILSCMIPESGAGDEPSGHDGGPETRYYLLK